MNNLKKSNLAAFGGPMAQHEPNAHYVGPRGCSSTRIVTK